MALDKVTYVDGETVITAENLNDIQDAIIDLEQGGTITVDSALSSTSENPVQNKVINQALGAKAPLASPTFTGTPKAPTAASGTSTTQLATTAFVQRETGGKQDKNLGAANAGKFLVVGSDGNITAVTMTAWQGGSY